MKNRLKYALLLLVFATFYESYLCAAAAPQEATQGVCSHQSVDDVFRILEFSSRADEACWAHIAGVYDFVLHGPKEDDEFDGAEYPQLMQRMVAALAKGSAGAEISLESCPRASNLWQAFEGYCLATRVPLRPIHFAAMMGSPWLLASTIRGHQHFLRTSDRPSSDANMAMVLETNADGPVLKVIIFLKKARLTNLVMGAFDRSFVWSGRELLAGTPLHFAAIIGDLGVVRAICHRESTAVDNAGGLMRPLGYFLFYCARLDLTADETSGLIVLLKGTRWLENTSTIVSFLFDSSEDELFLIKKERIRLLLTTLSPEERRALNRELRHSLAPRLGLGLAPLPLREAKRVRLENLISSGLIVTIEVDGVIKYRFCDPTTTAPRGTFPRP